jgi:LPXTG-site transpeptidase (sortase) family protein
MSSQDSASQAHGRTATAGRAGLFFVAVFLIGLGCIALAIVAIIGSRPASAAVGSSPPPQFAASDLKPVYRDEPAPKVDRSTGRYPFGARTAAAPPPAGVELGTLTIPGLGRTLPIVEGTDASELKRGVGHYARSAMPGTNNNCVLSGHRDTAFAGLRKVGVGAHLIVQTSAGEFTYQVREVRIVPKDDKTVIVPTDYPVLTLTTCYPFYYVGTAPDRYVLVADLVRSR